MLAFPLSASAAPLPQAVMGSAIRNSSTTTKPSNPTTDRRDESEGRRVVPGCWGAAEGCPRPALGGDDARRVIATPDSQSNLSSLQLQADLRYAAYRRLLVNRRADQA